MGKRSSAVILPRPPPPPPGELQPLHASGSTGTPWRWAAPRGAPPHYSLRAGDLPLMHVRLEGPGLTRAHAELAEGRLTARPRRAGSRELEVRVPQAGAALGRFTPDYGGGLLELESGAAFRLASTSAFQLQYAWTRADGGSALVRLLPAGGLAQLPRVDVSPAGRALVELPVLVFVGFLHWRRVRAGAPAPLDV